jgi:autotransporter-associated beta strand protein
LGNDTGNTSVAAGATLELQNNITVGAAEAITLGTSAAAPTASLRNSAGSNTLAGDIALSGAATQGIRIDATTGTTLALTGAITESAGTFINKTGGGTLALSGTTANTFTGGMTVRDGTLTLNKTGAGANTATGTGTLTIGDGVGLADTAIVSLLASNQLNDTAAVVLGSDGRLLLNNNTDTIGSIAGSGEIIMGTGQLVAGGNNSSTTFAGTLVGASAAILNKEGSGTLTIASNVNATPGDFAGTLNLNAGTLAFNVDNAFTGTVNVAAGTTLRLSNTDLNIANLNLTGSGTITLDFAGASSLLSVTNLNIAAGITLNIINWQNAVDYFFAANWTGAVIDTTGSAPMNQVIFNSPTWSGSDTKWQGYDDQITPVPEPSTYGALLLGAMGALLGYRRWRRAKTAKA